MRGNLFFPINTVEVCFTKIENVDKSGFIPCPFYNPGNGMRKSHVAHEGRMAVAPFTGGRSLNEFFLHQEINDPLKNFTWREHPPVIIMT